MDSEVPLSEAESGQLKRSATMATAATIPSISAQEGDMGQLKRSAATATAVTIPKTSAQEEEEEDLASQQSDASDAAATADEEEDWEALGWINPDNGANLQSEIRTLKASLATRKEQILGLQKSLSEMSGQYQELSLKLKEKTEC